MRKYEIMFIVRPDLEEANIKEVANNMKEVLKSEGATIVEEKAMGQRELAYSAAKQFDRFALINENISLYLIVRVEEI